MAHVVPPQGAEPKEEKKPTVLGTMGLSALGLGGGMLAGAGLGKALEAISKNQGINLPSKVPVMARVATGALGVAYPWWKYHEQQRINRAREST